MTILYAAATVPVNPPGAATVLTQDQLWAGLELKRTHPQLFLEVIYSCDVLEQDEDSVLREVVFKDGGGVGSAPVIGKKVQERITHIQPLTSTAGSGLETFQTIGSAGRVLNILSTGPNKDLYLTFTFEWAHPEIEAGTDAAVEKQALYQSTARAGVEGTLEKIREMVRTGKL